MNKLGNLQNAHREAPYEQQRSEYMKKFHTSLYEDQKNRNEKRIPGTCQWVTNHGHFKNWVESQRSSLLILSADPGCGKSVLTRYLVDEHLSHDCYKQVCYFFFKDDFPDQRSAESALRSLIHQLLSQDPQLLSDEEIRKLQEGSEQLIDSFSYLWSLLIKLIKKFSHSGREVVCVLDALDECEEKSRRRFMGSLIDLYQSDSQTKSAVKFLVTSRPYDHILRDFKILFDDSSLTDTIRLSGEKEEEVDKIKAEIEIVVKSRAHKVRRARELTDDEENALVDTLLSIEHRTYLWVALTMDFIVESLRLTDQTIKDIIKTIPKDVDDAYEKILSRSPDAPQTRRILHIVVGAFEPLTIQQMSLALTITEIYHSHKEEDQEPEDRFKTTIRDLCGLFVVIVDKKIYLIHQTAKEFLVRSESSRALLTSNRPSTRNLLTASRRSSTGTAEPSWKQSLFPKDSHKVLAEICIWYLTLDLKKLRLHVLDNYAGEWWFHHVRSSNISIDDAVSQQAIALCEKQHHSFSLWLKAARVRCFTIELKDAAPLEVSSALGLLPIVKIQLAKNSTNIVNAGRRRRHESARYWKLRQLAAYCIGSRLREGHRATTGQEGYDMAMVAAAEGGHERIVELLLAKGADVNAQGGLFGNALQAASYGGHERIVELLLAKGADVNAQGGLFGNALQAASRGGHERIVELLRANGAA
jgi:hypothetical protein